MDLSTYISYATFDVIGEVVFSKEFGFLNQGKDIGNAIANSLALNTYIACAGYFRWIHSVFLANPVMTWLSVLPMGHRFDTTKAAVAEREKNTRFDAIQYWFKQHEHHPDKLSIREINTLAFAAVGAGSDTVSVGIKSFVCNMMRHPDAWEREHAEVVEAVGKGLCRDRVVSYADAQQLR
jgi:hypothetical protein